MSVSFGKIRKPWAKVLLQCPNPTDTTSCFFTSGHHCHHFITMAAGVKQHLWVMDTIYNYGDKALVFMLPQFSNFTPELQPLAKSPLAKHTVTSVLLYSNWLMMFIYIYNLGLWYYLKFLKDHGMQVFWGLFFNLRQISTFNLDCWVCLLLPTRFNVFTKVENLWKRKLKLLA